MNAQHRRRLFSFGAAAAAAGLLFAATGALPARPAPASSQVLGASTLSAPFHPKMSAALARIAAGAAPEAEAAGSGLSRKTRTDAPDGMVRVVAELNYPVTTLSGQAAAASLKAKIEASPEWRVFSTEKAPAKASAKPSSGFDDIDSDVPF